MKQDGLTEWCVENYKTKPFRVWATILGMMLCTVVAGIIAGTLLFGYLLKHFEPIDITTTVLGSTIGLALAISMIKIRRAADEKESSEKG